MSAAKEAISRFTVYVETTETLRDGRTGVKREAFEDEDHRLRTYASPSEALAAWEGDLRDRGCEPRQFASERGSLFYEIVMPGEPKSTLAHVRVRKVAG